MATILQLVKRSYAKRVEREQEAARRQHPLDADLPLGLHIDGKVDLNPLLPQGLKMKNPGRLHIVEGFSKTMLFGKHLFKVFLHSETDATVSYLWIFKDDKQRSVRWFVSLDEVFPKDPAEWEVWFADADGLIGLPAFQTTDKTIYPRVWDAGNPDRVEPANYKEMVFPDRYDASKKITIERDSMLYGRRVDDAVCPRDELLLVSGTKEPDGNYVAIDIGIDIDPTADMKVVY